jgi:hypothetical protein
VISHLLESLTNHFFHFSRKSNSFLFRVHSKGASVETPSNEIQNSNLASANTSETETTNFKTAKIHNAYIQNAQFCCIAINSQKYYSFIAEQFCKTTAAENNLVGHESQNLSLMTFLLFLIEGLFKQIMYLLIFE